MIKPPPVLALLVVASIAGGCSKRVGAVCEMPGGPSATTQVSATARECGSRACMRFHGRPESLCTAECKVDDDCVKDQHSACVSKFVCAVATDLGPACCKKLCVCGDYLGGQDELAPPPTCDPRDISNDCCNLDQRRQNPGRYPQCR